MNRRCFNSYKIVPLWGREKWGWMTRLYDIKETNSRCGEVRMNDMAIRYWRDLNWVARSEAEWYGLTILRRQSSGVEKWGRMIQAYDIEETISRCGEVRMNDTGLRYWGDDLQVWRSEAEWYRLTILRRRSPGVEKWGWMIRAYDIEETISRCGEVRPNDTGLRYWGELFQVGIPAQDILHLSSPLSF